MQLLAMPRVSHRAITVFEAREYGSDYVDLRKGDQVELLNAPGMEEADADWSYGCVGSRGVGWFPTKFVRQLDAEEHAEPPHADSDLATLLKGKAKAGFDPEKFGRGYIELRTDDSVFLLMPPEEDADFQWSYGYVVGRGVGWFPTDLVTKVGVSY